MGLYLFDHLKIHVLRKRGLWQYETHRIHRSAPFACYPRQSVLNFQTARLPHLWPLVRLRVEVDDRDARVALVMQSPDDP